MRQRNTAVKIIGGFLGSGKTTYLNNILKQLDHEKRAAVIINEFGDIPLDGELIESGDYNKVEISGGCICCSLKEKLIDCVESLLVNENPDEIIIESTGLAVPWDMKTNLEKSLFHHQLQVDKVIVTVDSGQFKKMHGRLLIYDRQFEGAPSVLFTKRDLYSEELISDVRNCIASAYGDVRFFKEETLTNAIHSGSFTILNKELSFTGETVQFSFETDELFDAGELVRFCSSYRENILRMKGIIRNSQSSEIIQYDGLRFYRQTDPSGRTGSTRVVFFCQEKDREMLQRLFRQYF